MNRNAPIKRELYRAVVMGLAGMSLTGGGLLAYATNVEPKWLDVQEITLPLPHLHDTFRLYVDQEGQVRGDHEIRFLGLRVITLHYRMTPRDASALVTPGVCENLH